MTDWPHKRRTPKGWIVRLPAAKAFHSPGEAETTKPPGSKLKEYPALKVVFDLGWGGLIATSWPEEIALGLDIESFCKENPGIVEMRGKGGVGTRITFQLMNGHAIYEIIGYAATTHPKHPKVKVAELIALKKLKHPQRKLKVETVKLNGKP